MQKNLQSTLPPEVAHIGRMDLQGNIIPHYWYQHITFDSPDKKTKPKVDSVSILILAEIIYWYRPTYIRNEQTGEVISIKKKFAGDALQKSKKDLADQFGFTERQVKDSLVRLEKKNLITREYRTITTDSGLKISNVLYIKIHPEEIEKITYNERHPYDVQTSYPQRSNVIAPTFKRQTNTENTTKTTTNNNSLSLSLSEDNKPQSPIGDRETEKNISSSKDKKDSSFIFFGELKHVKLTADQHKNLLKTMTAEERDKLIQDLDWHIDDVGEEKFAKDHKSHYSTLQKWKRLEDKRNQKGQIRYGTRQQTIREGIAERQLEEYKKTNGKFGDDTISFANYKPPEPKN